MTEQIKNFQELGRHVEFETEFLEPKRGDIYLLDLLDVCLGNSHVLGKTRPCLVIQNDIGNIHSSTVVVSLISSYKISNRIYPMQYKFNLNNAESVILHEQIMTVDKTRLIKKLGELTPQQMKESDKKLMYSLQLNRFSLENVRSIEVTSRINVKTKTEEYIGFTIELLFENNEKLETKIKLEKLQELDIAIHSNIDFEDLKNKLDCIKGLNWLVNNNEL